MSIYEKLSIVQTTLKAPKNQYNSFGDYRYRSCEDILEALKPMLKEQKLALIIGDDIVMIGNRYYVKATAILTDIETGESITNTAFAREQEEKKKQDASQVTGGTSSYARKYCLNGLFCIDDNKDADTNENQRENNCTGKPGAVQKAEQAFGVEAQRIPFAEFKDGMWYLRSKNNGKWASIDSIPLNRLNDMANDQDYATAHNAIRTKMTELSKQKRENLF